MMKHVEHFCLGCLRFVSSSLPPFINALPPSSTQKAERRQERRQIEGSMAAQDFGAVADDHWFIVDEDPPPGVRVISVEVDCCILAFCEPFTMMVEFSR